MNPLKSFNPFDNSLVGSVELTPPTEVESRFRAAEAAQKSWVARSSAEREAILKRYAELLESGKEELARLITAECGKPMWESLTEAGAMVGKVGLSIQSQSERCAEFGTGNGRTWYHALGVVCVLGPFNFPGHLANGHIVPALLAGNGVLFKPSEQTPLVGQYLVERLHEAGIPADLVQCLHGGRELGEALVDLEGLRGLFFTGSSRAGLAIHRNFGGRPQTMLALEMGGNNPLMVDRVADPDAAVRIIAQSAFITAGQRCTCARRLLVREGAQGDDLIDRLVALSRTIRVGDPLGDPAPFVGTLISAAAADAALSFEAVLVERGAHSLMPLQRSELSAAQLSPGIMEVSEVSDPGDEECFGPLLQVQRYAGIEQGIAMCNDTEYGLAAGLLSDDADLFARFRSSVRAGIINWNLPLTGASSAAPFGGVGLSGNYRPSAYVAADYCAYPVASMSQESVTMPAAMPGLGDNEESG
jgi:succinylglutamic semialdehyde dehydrogenase